MCDHLDRERPWPLFQDTKVGILQETATAFTADGLKFCIILTYSKRPLYMI